MMARGASAAGSSRASCRNCWPHAPGLDAEWANAAKTQSGDLFPIKAAQHGLFRIGIRAQEDKLVLGQRNWPLLPRAVHGIKFLRRNPFFLKGREQVIGNVDFCPSGVGPGPVRQPVGGEILRRRPYHLGPDAGDHIPAHQRRRRPLVHETPAYFQHPARPTVWIQSLGQIRVHMVDFQAHGASYWAGPRLLQGRPKASDPLRSGAPAGHCFPPRRQLLSNHPTPPAYRQWQHDVVVLEGLQSVGGLEKVVPGRPAHRSSAYVAPAFLLCCLMTIGRGIHKNSAGPPCKGANRR